MYFRKLSLGMCDAIVVHLSFMASLNLRFDGNIPSAYLSVYTNTHLVLILISLITFTLFGLYRSLWAYVGTQEALQVTLSTFTSTLAFLTYVGMSHQSLPRSIYLIYTLLTLISIGGIRLLYRMLRRFKKGITSTSWSHYKHKRILLIGAGEAASLLISDIHHYWPFSPHVIIAVDDSPHKQHSTIHGVPIKGTTNDISYLVNKYHINKIIIAIPSASKQRISEILNICNQTSCKLEIFPGIPNSLGSASMLNHLRPVSIEDLLGREEIVLDNTPLHSYIQNKTILVTGGGGSIGSELCRQVMHYAPKKLILLDVYENNAYELQNELLTYNLKESQLEVIIGSVRDHEKLDKIFNRFHPDIVFHAAAHKHVPLMETNPCEAIKNNVYGTLNTALCAKQYNTEKFILISTDKAVNPTNIMGASKRMCELIIQSLASTSCHTSFSAVRFGNVLGSNGSVIPLFKQQLEKGGPLTVTHEEIIRYFMTIPEAVRLILQATTFAKGGEIFVLDMGKPVKILDLAKNFIKLSGLELGKDIDIEVTGLRPGEKLYEELLMDEEGLTQTEHNKIFIGKPSTVDFESLEKDLYDLKNYFYDEKQLKEAIMKLVPTYQPTNYASSILDQPHTIAAS